MRPSLTITPVRRDADQEPHQRPLDLGLIRRLFGHMRPHARTRNWLIGLVVLRAMQVPALAWSIGAVINGPITRGDWRGTLLGSLGFCLLAAFTHFTFHYRQRLALELGERVVTDLRNAVFAHVLKMPMSFFNRTKLGRLISRVTADVDAMRVGVQDVLFVGLVGSGQMLVAGLLMLWESPLLFLVVAGMTPVLWMLNRLFRKRFTDAARATQESFSRITATLAESVTGIRVTQGFVRQSVNADLFLDLVTDHSRYNLDMARTAGVFLPLLEMSTQCFIAVLLMLGGYQLLQPGSQMPVGTLIQFFFLTGVFFGPIQNLGNLYNQALSAMAGAERVFRLLDMAPEWADPPDARELPPIQGRVECRGLSFGYDPARPVLHDLHLVAEPGQTVALVGATGSGKTTLVNLIAKFYPPTAGQILIDGADIAGIKGESLHRQMALIQQQNFLFTGTVLENVRIGRPDATEAQVREAARTLDCLDVIAGLPDGFQTVVGERGAGISLGQRQMVCFLRAMIADPRILILDEATSSVDTVTEVRIQKALATLLKGRTCFVIAHRLSTVRGADQVLVLDRGAIIERGTHAQLLARRGVYTNLYRQFVRLGLGGGRAAERPPKDRPA